MKPRSIQLSVYFRNSLDRETEYFQQQLLKESRRFKSAKRMAESIAKALASLRYTYTAVCKFVVRVIGLVERKH